MRGKIAKVQLSEVQMDMLKLGQTVVIRLPKDVAQLRLSTVEGDRVEQLALRMQTLWEEIDGALKRFWKRK